MRYRRVATGRYDPEEVVEVIEDRSSIRPLGSREGPNVSMLTTLTHDYPARDLFSSLPTLTATRTSLHTANPVTSRSKGLKPIMNSDPRQIYRVSCIDAGTKPAP